MITILCPSCLYDGCPRCKGTGVLHVVERADS